jgi:sirohydrochlorin ferrochelatase
MRHSHLTATAGGTLPERAGHRRAWPPLVAVAHGSSDPGAAATITALMDLVRARAERRGLGDLDARAAYLGHALPRVPDVLEALDAAEAVVLPLLLTGAYHSDADLPAVLEAAGRRLPRLRISYGKPLGPNLLLLRALDRRLAQAGMPVSPASAADTAVVLAAAGSSRPSPNAEIARLAAAWRSTRGWRQVIPAYASAASPTPGQAVAGLRCAGVSRVVVATYLLAPGVFADQVREWSLAAGAQAVSPVLGAAPEVADLILERYLQAACASSGLRGSGRGRGDWFAMSVGDAEMRSGRLP